MTTNAQTEARVTAPNHIWATGSFHMGDSASGSWNAKKLSNIRTDIGEVLYVHTDFMADALFKTEAKLATALAAKDAEIERLKNLIDGDNCPDPDKIDSLFSRAERAERQLTEANKALDEMSAAANEAINFIVALKDHKARFVLERALTAREQGGK